MRTIFFFFFSEKEEGVPEYFICQFFSLPCVWEGNLITRLNKHIQNLSYIPTVALNKKLQLFSYTAPAKPSRTIR